jgi:pimeloyl-ACP methyl ester carboxylesterase
VERRFDCSRAYPGPLRGTRQRPRRARRAANYSTQFQFVGDVVGLVHALGCERAVIAGHDLGAMVAHNAAISRPDMFRAVILLSVPYGMRHRGRGQADRSNAQAGTTGTTVLPNIFPDARSGREGVRRRSEAHAAHVPVLAFRLNTEGAQMALHVRRKREGAGRLRGSEATPGMAEAGRSGLLRQRILEDGVSRRVELVSRAGKRRRF